MLAEGVTAIPVLQMVTLRHRVVRTRRVIGSSALLTDTLVVKLQTEGMMSRTRAAATASAAVEARAPVAGGQLPPMFLICAAGTDIWCIIFKLYTCFQTLFCTHRG